MVGTPMYGGMCFGRYMNSCIGLGAIARHFGVHLQFEMIFNESLITRARNYIADTFMRSDCTHLMFIDADIEFDPKDVLRMCALKRDVVAAPYPKKTISWEKVVRAVKENIYDESPENLKYFAADFALSLTDEGLQNGVNLGAPFEVKDAGTGFMAISRNAFEVFRKAYPDQEYTPDAGRSTFLDGSRNIHAFFDTVIDPDTRRYLSEDYMFTQWIRKTGLKVWMCPSVQLTHLGTYDFKGNFMNMGKFEGGTNVSGVDPTGLSDDEMKHIKKGKGGI